MKRSEHKTTMADVAVFIHDNGPTRALAIGDHFWPDKAHLGPSRGGPSSTHVSASRLLGRMRVAGYVEQIHSRHGELDRCWALTKLGKWLAETHAKLASQEKLHRKMLKAVAPKTDFLKEIISP